MYRMFPWFNPNIRTIRLFGIHTWFIPEVEAPEGSEVSSGGYFRGSIQLFIPFACLESTLDWSLRWKPMKVLKYHIEDIIAIQSIYSEQRACLESTLDWSLRYENLKVLKWHEEYITVVYSNRSEQNACFENTTERSLSWRHLKVLKCHRGYFCGTI